MPTAKANPSQQWPDEGEHPPGGSEPRGPAVSANPREIPLLEGLQTPSVCRFLGSDGETPVFQGWEGTWIEDA